MTCMWSFSHHCHYWSRHRNGSIAQWHITKKMTSNVFQKSQSTVLISLRSSCHGIRHVRKKVRYRVAKVSPDVQRHIVDASRRIFHGVPKVYAGTGPHDMGLPPGRLSITIRETGLPG